MLFEPVYSDFCKVPLCFGDCVSEASPMGHESPVHTLNRDGENVFQEMRGGLEILFFPGPAPGFLSISWDK